MSCYLVDGPEGYDPPVPEKRVIRDPTSIERFSSAIKLTTAPQRVRTTNAGVLTKCACLEPKKCAHEKLARECC